MRKVLTFILCLALALAIMPATMAASGSGTETDPYLVGTAAELTTALAAAATANTSVDAPYYIKLTGGFNLDINGTTAFSVGDGSNSVHVVLDLNGKTINGTSTSAVTNSSANTSVIGVRKGSTLVINDSVGTGMLTLITTGGNCGWNRVDSVVSVYGKLTVNAGTIRNYGGTDMTFAIDVLALSNATGDIPTLIVNSGVMRSDNYSGIRAFLNGAADNVQITINGGTVYGYQRGIYIQQPGNNMNNQAVLVNVTGGTIAATAQSAIVAEICNTTEQTNDDIIINISNATLLNDSNKYATVQIGEDGDTATGDIAKVTISGTATLYNTGSAGNIAQSPNRIGIDNEFFIEAATVQFSDSPSASYTAAASVEPTIIYTAPTLNLVDNTNTEVKASSKVTYTIIIPAVVDFGELYKTMPDQTQDFRVSIENALLEVGHSVNVQLSNTNNNNFTMYLDGNTEETINILSYSLYNVTTGGTALAANGLYCTFAQAALIDSNGKATTSGRVTTIPTNLKVAGDYSGTMVFDCEYVETVANP